MVRESDYADYVEAVLQDVFSPATVSREVVTESGRFCDILVETDLFRFAVEVENRSEDVVTNGVGQAMLYGDELDAIPVVVCPPDGENKTELQTLRNYVAIIELPYPDYE